MTTTATGMRYLHYRAYGTQPADESKRVEWAVEAIICTAHDQDDPDMYGLIVVARPDLTVEQIAVQVEFLLDLSDECADAADVPYPGARFHAAADEYADALHTFAHGGAA